MSRFLQQGLAKLIPYIPGEQPKNQAFLKLNTNESPFPPSPKVVEAITASEVDALRLYSDPTAESLVRAIADYYHVGMENVCVGNGSDEILAFAFHAFANRKTGVVFPEITYGFYPVFADFFGIQQRTFPLLQDYSINPEDYLSSDAMVVLANPNAQTGVYLSLTAIENIVKSNPERVVLIDEAYIDFGGESALPLTKIYPNLLVVQTFSKSRSLAGGRIGFAVGSSELISDLQTLRCSFNPYNLNRLSILAGREAIRDTDYFSACTEKIITAREHLKEKLVALNYTFTPSRANFVLAKSPALSGEKLYNALRENGILVRYLGGKLADFVRITIGTLEDVNHLYSILVKIETR